MSSDEQLSRELEAAIAKVLTPHGGAAESISVSSEATIAKDDLLQEEAFYKNQLLSEQIADIQSARTQREEYARKVFMLVGAWIFALFIILIAQGCSPNWHPFSDKVLIALICSMTVNLIGTLVIVLKYIFKNDDRR